MVESVVSIDIGRRTGLDSQGAKSNKPMVENFDSIDIGRRTGLASQGGN